MAPSGASEWTLAQVFSHIGSASEIGLAGLRAGLGDAGAAGDDFNRSVWDRWDAMGPREQVDQFLEHGEALVAGLEALNPQQRETLGVPVNFMPQPMPLELFVGMRLSELTEHGWDVRVGLDPRASLRDEDAELIAGHFSGGLSFFLDFAGKADQLSEPAAVDVKGSGYGLVIDEKASLTTTPGEPTATFDGPLESAMRLLAGRLSPEHTPAGVTVTGNVTLDDLRRVFPGY